MKNMYLLIVLLFWSVSAYGQPKSGLGFTVSTGNFTFPGNHSTYTRSSAETVKYQPGAYFGGGVHYQWQVSKRFSILSELLFRHAMYSVEVDNVFRFYDGINERFNTDSKTGYLVTESILSLPVKMQFALGSKHRTSLVLGSGISRTINMSSRETFSFYYLITPGDVTTYTRSRFRNQRHDFRFEYPVIAGLSRQISDKTTVGIEYTYQKRRLIGPKFAFDDTCDCCDCGYGFDQVPAVQNIAILMQYKLLK